MKGNLKDFEALDSRQFEIAIKRLADNLSYGADRSAFVGSGVEYVQSRPYEAGDPVRSIDWHVTARTGKPYIKEFEAPKRMPAYIVLDTSASMTFGTAEKSKYFWAVHIAGGLALACLDRVSPVGILGAGDRNLHMKPSLSKQQIMQWLSLLKNYDYHESTQLGYKLRQLLPSLESRSLVFVISDLHDDQAVPILKHAAHAHDCVVIQMRDPAEKGIRGVGFVRGAEGETGQAFHSLGIGSSVDQQGLEQSLKRAGLDHFLIDCDQPFAYRLRGFLKDRGLLGKGAR